MKNQEQYEAALQVIMEFEAPIHEAFRKYRGWSNENVIHHDFELMPDSKIIRVHYIGTYGENWNEETVDMPWSIFEDEGTAWVAELEAAHQRRMKEYHEKQEREEKENKERRERNLFEQIKKDHPDWLKS